MADQALQSISIPRTENRTLPTPHIVYAILISLPVRSWTVYRRYSEFASLNQAFKDSPSVLGLPPSVLPPKHAARSAFRAITGFGGLIPEGEQRREETLAQREERRQGLEQYLRAIVASPDDRWRESDEFRAFIELPKGQSTTAVLGVKSSGSSNRYVPGSYVDKARVRDHPLESRSPPTGGLATRTLGVKAPVQESDATRVLDDRSLLSSQQAQMDAQNQHLDGLSAIIRRQKAMGLAINQELSEQSDLIHDLDQNVDRTQVNMRKAERQMDRLR